MRLIVKKEDELLEFLYQNLDMPKKRIKQYLVHGSVYVNNNKVTQYNYRVLPGMKIVVSTSNQKTIFPNAYSVYNKDIVLSYIKQNMINDKLYKFENLNFGCGLVKGKYLLYFFYS